MTVATLTIGLEEARFKAAETVATGLRTLEFYAAAFSTTPDKNGDIIDPHAFDGWLKSFYAAGKALPISFNHAAVLDGLDPTNVVGYAPADPKHVWVDDYGLRVKGFLDTVSEKGKAVEWQIENGLLSGASVAFETAVGGILEKKDHNLITEVATVRETGPVPNPANQSAVLLWLKSAGLLSVDAEVPYMSVDEFRAIVMQKDAEPDPEPEPALKSTEGVQAAHDALAAAGAVCIAASPEPIVKAEPEVPKTVEEFVEAVRRQTAETIAGDAVAVRNRKLRMLGSSLP